VRAARAQADAVIVALHSGVEYTDAPQPEQQQLARAAIDAGAALVLGHHPHALQGWEYYGAGLIAYSLGNFVFDLDNDDVTLTRDGVAGARAVPVLIDPDEDRPRMTTPEEAANALERLETLHRLANP
jgi:poly-gamma-glutamate synthesis protein (capsule biosynthesis protein)